MKNKTIFSIIKNIVILIVFFSFMTFIYAKPPTKSKFYDFGEQIIDGEIKKPTALYTEGRKKVEFDRLLKMKKSFIINLLETSKDKVFK